MHFADRLIREIEKKKSVVCVGLDPHLDHVPKFLFAEQSEKFPDDPFRAMAETIKVFNKGLIDAVCDVCVAVKPQVAFYEQLGAAGVEAFAWTLQYAREKGLVTIADAKRNDIGSTAQGYANAFLGEVNFGGVHGGDTAGRRVFDADSVTVTPYLGWDGVKPFVDVCKKFEKGIFVLVRTSNPSAGDVQDLRVDQDGRSVYETLGHFVESWGADDVGERGYSCVGAVVGATYPKEARKLREIMPQSIFLVPGFGAQGATVEDIRGCFHPGGMGAIVNSSRDVMFAYEKSDRYTEQDFAVAAREKVITMNKELEVLF